MRKLVTTYYLEMTDPAQLRPVSPPDAACSAVQVQIACPELNRFFYTAVGGSWYWFMRLPWSYAEWQAYVGQPGFETWYGAWHGTPVGYFELQLQADGAVEIASFGLLPQFVGRGLGGWLLTAAVQRAWAMGAGRVILHTCTLDSPHALGNYQARGFRPVAEETEEIDLPDRTPGPWPHALGT